MRPSKLSRKTFLLLGSIWGRGVNLPLTHLTQSRPPRSAAATWAKARRRSPPRKIARDAKGALRKAGATRAKCFLQGLKPSLGSAVTWEPFEAQDKLKLPPPKEAIHQ